MNILDQNNKSVLDLKNDFPSFASKDEKKAIFEEKLEAAVMAVVFDPPSNNMGGTPPLPPLFLPHGEKKEENKTKIDWIGFSICCDFNHVFLALQIIWPNVKLVTTGIGMAGYPECKVVEVDDIQFGLFGYGAKHGRSSISLTGKACQSLANDQWELMYQTLLVLDARLSRLDICLDFYKGEVTIEEVELSYEKNEFKKKNAPVNPEMRRIDGVGNKGQNLGRTRYIGSRTGECMARIYEKGLEVFAKMTDEYKKQCTEREYPIDFIGPLPLQKTIGDDWVRLEVEFKRKKDDRPIPLEMIIKRDEYFAGAYPFFKKKLGICTGLGRGLLKTEKQITHDKLIAAHRKSYGNHVHSLREIGFTDSEIVNLLDTGLHNQKLLKSGLVEIEKQAYKNFEVPF